MESEDVIDRIEFTFDNYLFYATQREETFAEARKTCLKDGSQIANLNGVNFEKFSETFLGVFCSNRQEISDLRVQTFGEDYPGCYGLLDTKTGLTEDFFMNICEDNGYSNKYYTLCSRENKSFILGNFEGANNPLVLVILSFLLMTSLMTAFFYYFVKKTMSKATVESQRQGRYLENRRNVSFNFFFLKFKIILNTI